MRSRRNVTGHESGLCVCVCVRSKYMHISICLDHFTFVHSDGCVHQYWSASVLHSEHQNAHAGSLEQLDVCLIHETPPVSSHHPVTQTVIISHVFPLPFLLLFLSIMQTLVRRIFCFSESPLRLHHRPLLSKLSSAHNMQIHALDFALERWRVEWRSVLPSAPSLLLPSPPLPRWLRMAWVRV